MKRVFVPRRLILGCMAGILSLAAGVLVSSCQKESLEAVPDPPQPQWNYLEFTTGYTTGILSEVRD